MKIKFLKSILYLFVVLSISFIFYYSNLDTKSYNRDETFTANRHGEVGQFVRTVLITENSNNNGSIVAFGIITGTSLLGIVLLTKKEICNI